MEYLISFCIPVYNSEKTIKECVDLLIKMGNEVQIILSDDGSIDSSGKICQAYADSFEQVIFVSGENSGPSGARNRALDMVRGKYVVFLDADDYLETEFLDFFKKALENLAQKDERTAEVDFMQFGIVSEGTDYPRRKLLYDEVKLLNESEKRYLLALIGGYKEAEPGSEYYGLVTCKVFRYDVIKNTRFDSSIVGEDTMFAVLAMLRSERVAFLPQYLYHNRIVANSYSHKRLNNIVPMTVGMLAALSQTLKIKEQSDELMTRAYYDHALGKMVWCINADGRFVCKNVFELRKYILKLLDYEEFKGIEENVDYRQYHKRRKLLSLFLKYHLYLATALIMWI